MINSMTQKSKNNNVNYQTHRGLMSNFSDNHLPECYTCDVIFVCCFAEGFVLRLQRTSFTCYFTLRFLL